MHLAQPAWLVLLVLLPLLGVGGLLVARLRRKQWHAFVAPRLRQVLLRRSSALPGWLALGFLLAACASLILAMARPQGEAGTQTEKSIGRNVLIALDLSRSMRVKDVKPDRLAQAKVVIYELMEALPNERLGLIGFAGSAHLFAPLTIDHGAIRETVEQTDESWVPLGGSNLTSALRLAITTLRQTGQKNNALVILSDGEKHEGNLSAITEEAKKSGIYIFAIGVGTEDGGFVPNPDFPNSNMVDRKGKLVLSRLQPEVMRKLATDTNGRYALAGSGTDIPAMVKLAAKDLDSFEMKGRERRLSIEFYQWLVLPAILSLLVSVIAGTRWRGVKTAAALTLTLGLLPPVSRAGEVSAAAEALAKGKHEQARDAFHKLSEQTDFAGRASRFRLGEGTAAYRAKDFAGARAAFSGALLSADPEVAANAHFGLANTLFQLGWHTLAEEAYPTDPASIPDLVRFEAMVKQRLAEVLKADAPADGDTAGVAALEALIINWADALHHYDSASTTDPDNPSLRHNRDQTMAYLQRLRDLLEQEREQTQQAIPEPQPGPQPGTPGEPEGDGEPKPDEQGQPGDSGPPKDAGEQGNQGPKPNDKPKAQPDQTPKPKDDPKDGHPQPGDDDAPKPEETPQDRARRILGENSDLEKGPLRSGRIEYNNPEKDW
ncbi:MAG: VWA domain-containing protein [Verrucomicrobia bacterium]|nr:VWA domain-containing protein [Verrucomicrobiota bacterium]